MSDLRRELLGILSDTTWEHDGTWAHLEERVNEILAALGFTREDVELLRNAETEVYFAEKAYGGDDADHTDSEGISNFADHIAALLPPEEEK